ncbi:MAG: hypothetical protein E7240_04385 [Lachnospiraceae bacterium]|nr:hypothetical protein [Lachnospiraceae bacterium]
MTRAVEYYYDEVIGDTVTVIFMNMEVGVKGETVHALPEDRYIIYINLIYDAETQKKAFYHERDHIRKKDFEKDNVQVIEADAHDLEAVGPTFDPEKFFEEERKRKEREERLQKSHERIGKMLKAERRKAEREKKKRDKRNELLAKIGLQEDWHAPGSDYGDYTLVYRARRKSHWEE